MKKILDSISYFIEKLLSFLRVRSAIAGLEVSDEVLRLVYFDGKTWQLHAIRLAPGVLVNGKLNDRDAFISSLLELKVASGISGRDPKRKANVAVSLSSVNPYTQVFNLPVIHGEDLEKAITLNLQMASPGDLSQSYSSWQIVGHNEKDSKIEVLSAFMDRQAVDGIIDALYAAGFLAMAVESRALALARVLREKSAAVDVQKSYLLLDVDNAGLDILIVRNGQLYFEYLNPWRDIMDDKGNVSLEKFKAELVSSIHQVLNFYNQHWGDSVGAVVIAASVFQDDIEKAVAENFPLPAVRLTLVMGQPISPEWLVALGSSLRAFRLKGGDKEISLLGEEFEDKFQDEQLFKFLGFWEIALPVVAVLLVAMLAAADIFLLSVKSEVEAQSIGLNSSQDADSVALMASSTAFNDLVSMAQGTEGSMDPIYGLVSDVQSITGASNVAISSLSYPGIGQPISLAGVADSEDDIVALKAAFGQSSDFSSVNLPLEDVKQNGSGYSFSMTFTYNDR